MKNLNLVLRVRHVVFTLITLTLIIRASLITNAQSPLTLNPAELPNARYGTPYSQEITISGGNFPLDLPYVITISSGQLPPGLSIRNTNSLETFDNVIRNPESNPIFEIVGTPENMSAVLLASGSFSFILTVSARNDVSVSQRYSIDIEIETEQLQESVRPNGCGASGGAFNPPDDYFLFDFELACNRHDACYGTIGVDRNTCDNQFLVDLLAECPPLLVGCITTALSYHYAVVWFGSGPFDAGQIANLEIVARLHNQAMIAFGQGDFEDALAYYTEALTYDNDPAYLYYLIGNVYYASGQFGNAISSYNEAIERGPIIPIFFYARGNLYAQQGDTAAAIADYLRYVELVGEENALPEILEYLAANNVSFGGVGLTEEAIIVATAIPGSKLLDLIFVIDTTGSMQDDINEVQRRALEIINQVAASGSDWQIGIVTYRDHPQSPYGDPGDYVSRIESGFTADQNSIISAINGITVGGGGDGPEAVYAGLMEAIGFPWRNGARKVLILMGDAPPHDPDPILGYTSETVLQAAYDVNPAQIFPILIASENAVRFPFQVLADGSSGRLFYADNAEEVVPTLLSTIDVATGIELSVGLEVQIASLEPSFPLRNSPSMLAGTVINLSRSEQATIIGGPEVVFEMSDRNVPQNFIWWQIRTESGNEGWMQETYYGEPILAPYSPDNPIAPVTCTLSTLGDINIRSGPGTNYQQIASRAGANQPLAANGQFGNISVVSEHWWQLIDGFWVRNDQVRENGDCASLPVVPAP